MAGISVTMMRKGLWTEVNIGKSTSYANWHFPPKERKLSVRQSNNTKSVRASAQACSHLPAVRCSGEAAIVIPQTNSTDGSSVSHVSPDSVSSAWGDRKSCSHFLCHWRDLNPVAHVPWWSAFLFHVFFFFFWVLSCGHIVIYQGQKELRKASMGLDLYQGQKGLCKVSMGPDLIFHPFHR